MLKLILTTLLIKQLLGAPQPQEPEQPEDEEETNLIKMSMFHVNSEIQYRYSITTVKAFYKNQGNKANKAAFRMVIPESAFISNFTMTVDDEEFVAEVNIYLKFKRNRMTIVQRFSSNIG